jgi:hypothetical protein
MPPAAARASVRRRPKRCRVNTQTGPPLNPQDPGTWIAGPIYDILEHPKLVQEVS